MWSCLDEARQELSRQLEMVESSIPSVGLVEESEDRLVERTNLYQVWLPTALSCLSDVSFRNLPLIVMEFKQVCVTNKLKLH